MIKQFTTSQIPDLFRGCEILLVGIHQQILQYSHPISDYKTYTTDWIFVIKKMKIIF